MQIKTIKIHAADAEQGAFVVINLADFNSDLHTPFDDEARAELGAALASGDLVPSTAELRAAHERLIERERELDAERDRLAEDRRANEAEARRLADEKAAAEKLARETADAVAKAAAEKAVAKPAKPAAEDKK